jgi:5-methylcytosine-specific restriction endonuclease McrA
MPGAGRPWHRERALFKAKCAETKAECWLCKGKRGPIDYTTKTKTDTLAFTVDHHVPTSRGGDVMRVANWRPAHFGCNSSRGNGTRGEFPTSRQW